MNSIIFKDVSMEGDFESNWTAAFLEKIYGYKKQCKAISVQIVWNGIDGIANGKILVLCSNDLIHSAIGMEINIASDSNLNDPELIIIDPLFKYLKLKYIANSISDGVLNAIITYQAED